MFMIKGQKRFRFGAKGEKVERIIFQPGVLRERMAITMIFPSIRDVAKQAGVSIGTVSRAFNGYGDINAGTKARILQVAKELGYVPNRSARNLSAKNNHNIALVFSDYQREETQLSETVPLLIKGAAQYAQDMQMELTAYFITPETQQQRTYDQFCKEHSLSGAMLFGIRLDEPWYNLQNMNTPCVTVDVEIHKPHVGCVLTDDTKAFEEISDHLIAQGHRRIAVLYGREQSMVANKRWKGLSASFKKHGITVNPDWIIYTDFMLENAYTETKRFLLAHSGAVTAFLCMSDVTAFSAIRALTESGFRVPDDYSVTGYDGFSIGQWGNPTITSVDQNFFQKGYEGAGLLHDMLEGSATANRVIVPYRMMYRDSVAAPALRHGREELDARLPDYTSEADSVFDNVH